MLSCTCILFNLHVCRDFLSCEVSPLLFCFIFNNLHMDLTASLCPSFLCSASLHRYPCTAHLSISPSMVHIIEVLVWVLGCGRWHHIRSPFLLIFHFHHVCIQCSSFIVFECLWMPPFWTTVITFSGSASSYPQAFSHLSELYYRWGNTGFRIMFPLFFSSCPITC